MSPCGDTSVPARMTQGGAIAVKEEKVEMTGEVVEALRSGMYRVALEGGRHEVLAYTAGKMRKFRIPGPERGRGEAHRSPLRSLAVRPGVCPYPWGEPDPIQQVVEPGHKGRVVGRQSKLAARASHKTSPGVAYPLVP